MKRIALLALALALVLCTSAPAFAAPARTGFDVDATALSYDGETATMVAWAKPGQQVSFGTSRRGAHAIRHVAGTRGSRHAGLVKWTSRRVAAGGDTAYWVTVAGRTTAYYGSAFGW